MKKTKLKKPAPSDPAADHMEDKLVSLFTFKN